MGLVVLGDELVGYVDRRIQVCDRSGLRRARKVEDQDDVPLRRIVLHEFAQLGLNRLKGRVELLVVLGLQILAAAAGQGLQADFSITNFSRSEALEEAITVSVTAKVTYSTTAPSWIGS